MSAVYKTTIDSGLHITFPQERSSRGAILSQQYNRQCLQNISMDKIPITQTYFYDIYITNMCI